MLDDIWVGVCCLPPVLICILLPDPPPPPYSGSGASHAGLSRGAETQLQDTGDTGSYRHTLSPLQSSEHAAEKCTCVLCSGNIAKNVLFSRKIWPDISFCQQSCIALHYVYCFAFGILIDLIMNNYNRNKACFNEYLRSSINIFMDGSRYVEMMSDIIV